MHISQAYVAAKHTESILKWVHTLEGIDEAYLRQLFNTIYDSADHNRQHALTNGSYDTWKETTFDGVRLAYRHFHDGSPHHFEEIKKYLVSVRAPENWLALSQRKEQNELE